MCSKYTIFDNFLDNLLSAIADPSFVALGALHISFSLKENLYQDKSFHNVYFFSCHAADIILKLVVEEKLFRCCLFILASFFFFLMQFTLEWDIHIFKRLFKYKTINHYFRQSIFLNQSLVDTLLKSQTHHLFLL